MPIYRPTRREAIALGAAGLTATALPAAAQDTRGVEVMAMGDENAPVTVVEYHSLTCPHCARFHSEVFSRIKTDYIETGKVRFEVRDVYFDRLGLWGAMVARCGGQERYFGIVDRLYKRQSEWSRAQTANEALTVMFDIGRQAGMTDEQMNACVQNQAWAEELVAEYQKNMAADNVEGTPTFFINGRKEPNMSYADFSAKLDAALGS